MKNRSNPSDRTDQKKNTETALRAFSGADLRAAAIGLLNTLGYQSEKTLDLDNTPDAFLAEFDKRDREFRKDKALFERWKSVEFLFQITDDEIQRAGGPAGLDFQAGFDARNYQSYLFFALDLENDRYTRTQLSDITREINLLFDMPAMLLLRHDGALTFSIIDRRLHKKDQSHDVLDKVKLIKDIRYQDPHRAHIEILHDLALQSLMAKHKCRDFKQLHEAWRTTLDTNELNKKFYRELADWYFWALDHVEFPDDIEKDKATRNATNVIRLLTRLIFCWFLKEKDLIPAELFSEHRLAEVLKSLKDDDSTPSSELVRRACRLLKQDFYYDKMDFFLRANVAAYEDGRGRMMVKKQIFKAGFILVTGPIDSKTLFHRLRGSALENNHLCLCQVDLIERET